MYPALFPQEKSFTCLVVAKTTREEIYAMAKASAKAGGILTSTSIHLGQPHFVYSWRLLKSDVTPKGKKPGPSLREMEEEIQVSLDEELLTASVNMTVYELVERYIAQTRGVRENTETGYRFIMNILRKERFGMLMIHRVRLSDAKLWLIKLQKDGHGYSTIHAICGVLRPAFQIAVDDDLIRKNPFGFHLNTVVVNDSVTGVSISPKQEQAFPDFVKDDNHFSRYCEGIFILFKTGRGP